MNGISNNRVLWARVMAVAALGAGLAGCGSDAMPYPQGARQQGLAQFSQASYPGAASSFQSAIRQEPGDYTSRYYLGQSYEKMGKPQQAIEEYRTTLEVMSRSLEGRTDLEVRRKVVDSLASAIAKEPERSGDLAALERQPRTAENAFLLAKIYRQSGDADMALTRFDQAQQLDPKDPLIAKEYGLYLEQLGQNSRADRELRRAYALNSRDEEVAAGLRRLGIVPGPSLNNEDALAKPSIPLGPLPEVDLTTSSKAQQPGQAPPTAGGPTGAVGTSASPRD